MSAIKVGVLCTDRIPPSLNFYSPGNGAAVSGTMTLAADVHDNDQIAWVQLFVDGVNYWGLLTVPPYAVAFDTHVLGNGGHSITAIVSDRIGNQSRVDYGITVNNVAPAAGITYLGDLQTWYDGNGDPPGYYGSRSGPEPYDGMGGDWRWSVTNDKTSWVFLPGNPDPTHYQMRVWMHGERTEGGTDGNLVHLEFNLNGAVIYDWVNGPLWFWNLGPLANVNGGEGIWVRRWCTWPGNNNCFSQGLGAYYDFVPKPGYAS